MNSKPQKIKLEEEVESPSSVVLASGLPFWSSGADQAIYREAALSFEQLIESYRYRSAGHPVAIKIEEVEETEEELQTRVEEIAAEDPDFMRPSAEERLIAAHLEDLSKATKRGVKRAHLTSHFKRSRVSSRYQKVLEWSEEEALAAAAEVAANTNQADILEPDPEPDLKPKASEPKEPVAEPKVEDCDC